MEFRSGLVRQNFHKGIEGIKDVDLWKQKMINGQSFVQVLKYG